MSPMSEMAESLSNVAPEGPTSPAAPDATVSPNRLRLVDATLVCLARYGVAKLTVDDLAREAGLSRATVYRTFPGGRDEILQAVVDTEASRFFSALAVRLGGADNLESALVGAISEATARLEEHEALGFLIEHEPELVLTHLAFSGGDQVLAAMSDFVAPFLARWMTPEAAGRAAEWVIRIVLSYVMSPSDSLSLSDEAAVSNLVATLILPGVLALADLRSPSAINISPYGAGGAGPAATTGPLERPSGASPDLSRSRTLLSISSSTFDPTGIIDPPEEEAAS